MIESSAMMTGMAATSRGVGAVDRSSVVGLLLLRKMLWRSKSDSKLYSNVVLGDHDVGEHVIRGVGYGRGEGRRRAKAQVAVRLAAAVRESRGRQQRGAPLSIVFTPGLFLQGCCGLT